jgi:hypothetical protein
MEKERFIIIPDSILSNKKLSGNAKVLYGKIYSLCKSDGKVCFASNTYFQKTLCIDPRTVSRLIKELEKEKLIISLVSKFKDNKYKRRITLVEQPSNDPNKPF